MIFDKYPLATLEYVASIAPIGRFMELGIRYQPFTRDPYLWAGRGDGTSYGFVDVRTLVGEAIADAVNRGWIVECGQSCRVSTESLVDVGGEASRELSVVYGFEEPDADVRVLRAWHAARAASVALDALAKARRA